MKLALLALVALVACSSKSERSAPPPAPGSATLPATPAASDPGCARMVTFALKALDAEVARLAEPVVRETCARFPDAVRACLASAAAGGEQGCLDALGREQALAFQEAVKLAVSGCAIVRDTEEPREWTTWVGSKLGHEGDLAGAGHELGTIVADLAAHACNAKPWPAALLRCLGTSDEPPGCFEGHDAERAALEAHLTPYLALWKRTLAAISAKGPTCAQTARAHYGPARWSDRIADPAQRVRTALAAEKVLAADCERNEWSPFQRACLAVAMTDLERTACVEKPVTWGYPPAGPAERLCPDDEAWLSYAVRCERVTPKLWDELVRGVIEQRAGLAGDASSTCGAARAAGRRALVAAGCALSP